MSPDDYASLLANIRVNGLIEPITLFETKILDGRHRARACEEAGVEPRYRDLPNDIDALEYVLSENLHRRHLTSEQRAAVAVEADAYRREQEAARERRVSVLRRGPESPVVERIPQREKGKARDHIAGSVKVNSHYISDAARLKEQAPEVFEAIKAGQMTMPVAREVAKLDGEARSKALTAAVEGGKSHATKAVREIAQQERATKIAGLDQASGKSGSEKKVVFPGEWWRLGRHLLYCGDTSIGEFRSALPLAAFAFADPPYGAGVDVWDDEFVWDHDYLADVANIVAVTPGISSIFEFARRTEMPYHWSLATWIANSHARGAVGFGNWIYTALFSRGSVHRAAQDFSRATIELSTLGETSHEGRKPSEYMSWLIETFTKPADMVIDPFGGAGTTLLVAERLGRSCSWVRSVRSSARRSSRGGSGTRGWLRRWCAVTAWSRQGQPPSAKTDGLQRR